MLCWLGIITPSVGIGLLDDLSAGSIEFSNLDFLLHKANKSA